MRPSARVVALTLIAILVPWFAACVGQPLLFDVGLDRAEISPNGDGVGDKVTIRYAVARPSRVSIWFIDSAGAEYVFRDREPRSAGEYRAVFDGTYEVGDGRATRRVLPDGLYRFRVLAEDRAGNRAETQGELTVRNGDRTPVMIENMTTSLSVITPNADRDRETIISYGITKDAEVVIFAIDQNGRQVLLEERTAKKAALYSHYWNGTAGGVPLPDGRYAIHIQAFDKAGNVSEEIRSVAIRGAGKADIRITRVDFSPRTAPIGGDITVMIRVKNFGDVPVPTQGPPPGTPYRTDITYNYWTEADGATPRFYDRVGLWRVAVMWDSAGSPYPVRWGFFEDTSRLLQPGEEVVVTGTIKLLPRQRELRIWAAIEEGGRGFPGGDVGMTTITIAY
ncbi:MAG: hypothetical protein NZ518_02725 [Dehalococcoidia bacterium]|nr:hypothetical protein [Dehalococcoidia bacterium]